VDSLDKPRAARALASDGMRGLRQSIGRTRLFLAMVTGGYLGLIILFAGPALHLAFGKAYMGHALEVRILALAFYLICLNQPSETFLIVLRESKLMFIIRSLTAAASVAALWWGSKVAGVTGCATALFAVQLLNLANLRIGEYVAERRYAASRPSAPQVSRAAEA
jgi:O-antigen/teichoic acid export membrane protein